MSAQFSHLADLADQWDREAADGIAEADGLPSTAGTAPDVRRRLLLDRARLTQTHAEELRAAMRLTAAGALS